MDGLFFKNFLSKPFNVFIFVSSITLAALIVDGSLFRLLRLKKNHGTMSARVESLKEKMKTLDFEIHQASKLTTIERRATDQFDYVREGDLIFVFSE